MSNFEYILTLPGILKLCSLISGLVVVALFSAAFDTGIWYHTLEGPDVVTGKPRTYNMEKYCNNLHKIHKALKDEGKEGLDPPPKPCPQSWIVILSISISTIVWLATLGMFVAYIIKDLNLTPKGKTISRVDTLIHLVGGLLFLVVMSINIEFLLTVVESNFGRSHECNKSHELFFSPEVGAPAIDKKKAKGRHNIDLETPVNDCLEFIERVYQAVLLAWGMEAAIVAGILCLFAAVLIYRRFGIQHGTDVPTMMMMPVQQVQVRQQPSVQYSQKHQQGSQDPQVPVEQAKPSKTQTDIQS